MADLYKVSEIQINYQPHFEAFERPKITDSYDAYSILYHSFDNKLIAFQEQAKVMLLNRNMRVLGVLNLSKGGMTETSIDPKIVFSTALKAAASEIIIAHNHPSGNLEPSPSDKLLTNNLSKAGKLLQMQLRDHLIITPKMGRYFSFADGGLL